MSKEFARSKAEPARVAPVKTRQPEEKQSVADMNLTAVLQRSHDLPAAITPNEAAQLQRTLGNQKTRAILTQTKQPTKQPPSSITASLQRMLATRNIQAKLTVNAPNDQYEQEADTTAKQVVAAINAPAAKTITAQRQEEDNAAEQAMAKPLSTLQRQEDDELAMTKPDIQRVRYDNGGAVDEDVERDIQGAQGKGHPLADNVRGPIEQAFGADFSGVNIHTDSQSDQLNQAVQAKAFTTGQDIFFRQGEYSPSSQSGQELLAHELTHVVQQTGGRPLQRKQGESKPFVQMKRGIIQRAIDLEAEGMESTGGNKYYTDGQGTREELVTSADAAPPEPQALYNKGSDKSTGGADLFIWKPRSFLMPGLGGMFWETNEDNKEEEQRKHAARAKELKLAAEQDLKRKWAAREEDRNRRRQ